MEEEEKVQNKEEGNISDD